jgi:amino acid adenylation domain-containing protein
MVPESAFPATVDKRIPVSVFEHVAATYRANVAVSHGGREITFGELAAHVDRIAAALRNEGVGRDVIVAMCFESSIEYIASLLAVMKAGGIFMPIDLNLPGPRIENILDLAAPALSVGSPAGIAGLLGLPLAKSIEARGVSLVTVDDGLAVHVQRAAGSPRVQPASLEPPGPDDSSYIMFTSGSTGKPKGILGRTKSLGHFMHWEAREFGFDETLRVSQFAPVTFDASLRDILLPLSVGGRVCIPPRDVRGDAARLVDWLEQAGVTLVHCVPSVFRLLTGEVEARGGGDSVLPRLRNVLMAGEALYGSDVMRWMDLVGARCELTNMYGPSETTLIKTFHRVQERPAGKGIISIGKPLPNTAVLVVKGNRLCDIGEIGDIYIDTPFASKGYFKDPERTAESFVANPIAADSSAVVYKTGDLGRYLPDRSLEFVGRLDTQVKVNGIRIELGEVQGALAGFAAIELAVVLALPNADQENRLVCYYTEKQPANPQAIRAHLRTTLPEYMIPTFYVRMEQFPLTVTGKVDRKALPKPEELLYDQAGYDPPSGDIEQGIAAIWSDVLSLGKVGATSRFTELGGNSLRAIRIISRISRGFGVELTIPAFFEHATVRKLARVVGEAATAQPFTSIAIAERRQHDQLSHAQQRLWILGQIDQGLTAYNNTHAVLLDGPLDRVALQRALAALLQRHESLRTSFVTIDDKPRQVVLSEASLPIVEHDLRGLGDPDAALRDYIVAASKTAFDLTQGPLIRLHVLQRPASPEAGERHALVLVVHHIVADGWSMSVLQREMSACYQAFRNGGNDPLPPLRIQYRDFCAWQRGRLESDAAASHRDYWLRQLSGDIRGLDLPADHPRPAAFTFTGHTRRFQLSPELTAQLKRLAERADASLFMLLVAAVKVLLYRYTGRGDIIVGTPIAGRDHADLEDQVGFYASTLVLRDELAAERSFLETLGDVRQTCLDAYQHQTYPFDLLLGGLRLERDASRNPVFDVMVVMQEAQDAAFTLDGLAVTEIEVGEEFSRFDLTFNFQEVEDRIQLDLNYNDALFEPDRIGRLAGHLTQLCASALADPAQPIGRLDILPADERRQLESYSRTAPASAETRTLIELFEDQARQTPDRPAVVCGERTLSYETLNARAGQLAAFLKAGGSVGRGDVVGVSLERSEWAVVATLAILKAQGVYMPIDPQLPAERAAHMLNESQCRAVLIDRDNGPAWSAGAGPAIGFIDVQSVGAAAPESIQRSPDDPAYVIYTSGSTGWPKGVVVSDRAFVNMIVAQRAAFAVNEQDRVLQFFASSFDGSLSEIFTALLSGAALVLIDRATILDSAQFAAFMRRQAITVVQVSPSYLHRLGPGVLDSVKTLIMAGEAAISEDARAQARSRRTFNAYGPTEAAVCATLHRVSADDDRHDGFIPIGRPIAGIEILVLDEQGAPAPIGIPGDIGIAGAGLAIGYSHRPDLTSERFVPHPVRDGERLYRTGDRGCWLADGTLRYVGRSDDQVKVGGYRIECGEVERCLLQVAGVREAAVFVRETGGGAQLAACLVGIGRERLPDLRAELKRRLPDFMVPALLTVVDHLPLTAGGKADKRALARLLDGVGRNEQATAPRTDVERELIAVWERVLGRTGLGIDDDFFDAGGTSLAAIEVLAAVRRQFETSVAVLELYRSPTVRGLAERLAPSEGIADVRPFILYNRHAARTVFCLPAVADPDGLIYGRLAAELPSWRLCGVQFTTIECASAAALADLIQEVQPQGPYTLLGYSAGGNLAFAAARELERRGSVVANLALVDSYHRDRVEPLAAADRQALIDHQVQNAAVLNALGEEESPGGLIGRMGQYLDALTSGFDEGTIDAPIHLLRAEDRADAGDVGGWARATTARFSESTGTGTHERMLGDQHLKDNASRLAAILDPGTSPFSEVENES